MAIGDGKVFTAQADATVVALDQATGRPAWKTRVADWKNGSFFSAAPLYWDGMILTATSGGDTGARCQVVALDAKTGKLKWRFFVIPNKGQRGFASWPKIKDWNGGGAMWNSPAVDPNLRLLYINTGNPIPYEGVTRGPGQELYTDSILALHVDTGRYAWHFQTVHHDIWDYDIPQSGILFDLQINGRLRHGIAAASKTGWVYILDRATGKPILGIPEKKVPQLKTAHTYATQPYPVGQAFAKQCASPAWRKLKSPDKVPYKAGCIFLPYDDKAFVAFAPAALGGVDWPASSYSPETGYMYVCSKDSQSAWKATPADKVKLQPLGNFSQIISPPSTTKTPASHVDGRLVAMDLRTNRIAWQRKWGRDMCYSGVMSTAGGLVFVGRNSGFLQAYDARTGLLLWTSKKLVAGVNAAPITYTVHGKQYVAVFAGGNGIAGFFGVKPYYGSTLYTFAIP